MTVKELLSKYSYSDEEVRFYEGDDPDNEAYRDIIENVLNSRTYYLKCEVDEFLYNNDHLEILLM